MDQPEHRPLPDPQLRPDLRGPEPFVRRHGGILTHFAAGRYTPPLWYQVSRNAGGRIPSAFTGRSTGSRSVRASAVCSGSRPRDRPRPRPRGERHGRSSAPDRERRGASRRRAARRRRGATARARPASGVTKTRVRLAERAAAVGVKVSGGRRGQGRAPRRAPRRSTAACAGGRGTARAAAGRAPGGVSHNLARPNHIFVSSVRGVLRRSHRLPSVDSPGEATGKLLGSSVAVPGRPPGRSSPRANVEAPSLDDSAFVLVRRLGLGRLGASPRHDWD